MGINGNGNHVRDRVERKEEVISLDVKLIRKLLLIRSLSTEILENVFENESVREVGPRTGSMESNGIMSIRY